MKYIPIYTVLEIGQTYKIEKYNFVENNREILPDRIFFDKQSAKDFCKK